MKLRRIISAFLIVAMLVVLSGCNLLSIDTAEFLSPPSLPGDISPISEAISKSIKVNYTLAYPSTGKYRSAVIQKDIDSDGVIEAFTFYSTTDAEVTTMHINVICKKNGKWTSISEQKIIAGGVDKVEFCDLDNDDIDEILVGWQIYGTSEMQLAVYSLKDDILTQRMLQKYTNFTFCDIDEDGKNEIFVNKFNSLEGLNMASLYVLTESGVSEAYTCALDPTAKAVNTPLVATLSSGKTAIYLDEIKGVGAVTEVLFIEKNDLVNPLFDVEAGETVATLRSASLNAQDINNDGTVEIPVQENVPSITKSEVNEKLYLTNWCSYNGEKLTKQITTMMNLNDGYYYAIPSKWNGKIAILKDTDKRLREIYEYNSETMTAGEKLLYIQAVDKKDWDSGKYKDSGLEEISYDNGTSYICWLSDKAKLDGITHAEVKLNFKLLE